MPIIVIRKGQEPKKLGATVLTQEEYLQQYIHDNPAVIPLDDIREDLRLFVFAREFPTPSGPIDALAVDDEGAIYIIETKLYKNPDKRLVVAQVLDYGAGLWKSFGDYSEIEHHIDQAVSHKFGMPLRRKLQDLFGIDELQVDTVLNRFKSDLSLGRFTFSVFSDGVLQINFGWLNDAEATLEFRRHLKEVLADTAHLTFPTDYEEKYVTFQAKEWTEKVADIIEGLTRLIGSSNRALQATRAEGAGG